MSSTPNSQAPIALFGYSVESMEAAASLNLPFVAVVPAGFETQLEADGIQTIVWDFYQRNENSGHLAEKLLELGARVAVPLYEETVEWAGAVNARIFQDPRAFQRSLLFRDKAMMKRNAQMMGIRVGVFEEVASYEDVHTFFDRVNNALLRVEGEVKDPVHLKPLSAAGSVGHVVIQTPADIDALPLDTFPCLAESHLDGKEFSVEAFVHNGKIRFMNITEYVHLGYSQIVPAAPELAARNALILKAVKKLVKAFQIENGMIHPEYFLDHEGDLHFGEVAARVPGGHIFELIKRAHGFDPYAALLLCADPSTSDKTLNAFFPKTPKTQTYAANLMVYPRQQAITALKLPDELLQHPYFERHDLFEPIAGKVADRVGFGNHYGSIFLGGEDPEVLRGLVEQYEDYDFYV